MKFVPKTEEELKKFEILPKGIYDFDVLQAEDTVSKSGNEMIKLTLGVYAPNGSRTYVYDYLLSSVEYKLKHFCDAVGLITEYNCGSLTADMCVNRSGKCTIIIQKDKEGKYDDKNAVRDYHPAEIGGTAPEDDSDIPF